MDPSVFILATQCIIDLLKELRFFRNEKKIHTPVKIYTICIKTVKMIEKKMSLVRHKA